jgi:UDP:flavonoid glycosyltransferase YjiC (YdhE family)
VDPRAFLENAAAELTGRPGLGLLRRGYSYLTEVVGEQFSLLREEVPGADCLLTAGVQIAGSSVAEALDVRHHYVVFCPILIPSREHLPPTLAMRTLPRWLNPLAWWLEELVMRPLLAPLLNRERAALRLPRVRHLHRLLMGDAPLLAVDPELAPAPSDAPTVHGVGQFHVAVEGALPPKLEAFLAAGPRPVYLGFGSMPDASPQATTEMAISAARHCGRRLVLSSGWAGLGDGPLPEDVMVVGDVCHDRLFPRMAAIVHHGGAGTTHAATRAGVPQLVVAHLADQWYWGRRVHALGIGPPPLRRNKTGAEALGESLHAALDAEWLNERADELGARVRARLDPARSVAELFEPAS